MNLPKQTDGLGKGRIHRIKILIPHICTVVVIPAAHSVKIRAIPPCNRLFIGLCGKADQPYRRLLLHLLQAHGRKFLPVYRKHFVPLLGCQIFQALVSFGTALAVTHADKGICICRKKRICCFLVFLILKELLDQLVVLCHVDAVIADNLASAL